jgi:hypothetical protein
MFLLLDAWIFQKDSSYNSKYKFPFIFHFIIMLWCPIWKMLHLALRNSISVFRFLRHLLRFMCEQKYHELLYRSPFSRKIHEMEIGKLQLHFRVSGEIILDLWCMGKWFEWLARPDVVHSCAKEAKAIHWPIPSHWRKAT